MGKKANELAMRDPALAALLGVVGSDFGAEPSNFGGEATFGGTFGDDYGDDYAGDSWNGMFGADAPAAPAPAAVAATRGMHPAHAKIIHDHMQRTAHRNKRALLLEPNKYSDIKVEQYTFSVSATITALGTAGALTGSNSPDVNFRPQRATANVVSPGMVIFSDVRVANVSFTVGGLIDAWQWNANAVGQRLDVPTLTPANKATFSGSYSGIVPAPLSGTGTFPFILSFTGPASIVA